MLIENRKPVALVESEKTAVIASVYLPQFVWLAVGSLTNLNAEKCSILKGRTVILFPDLNGYEKWSSKAKELSSIILFTVSDLLENKATEAEKKQGFDIADYLIKFNYKEFISVDNPTSSNIKNLTKPHIEDLTKLNIYNLTKPHFKNSTKLYIEQPQNWNNDIAELENYIGSVELPTHPIKLNQFSTITDITIFIENHLSTIKANNGKRTFLPYLNRLKELKQVLTTNLN